MVSNEEKKEDKAEAFSWWCDGSHNRPNQSQWLQTNLSELDEKIKVMLSIIEEDGDSFAKRAEMYYKRRPQLVKVLKELHKSYSSLAEKYDQLRFHDHHRRRFSPPLIGRVNPRMSSFSPAFRSLRQIQNHETKQTLAPKTPTSENSSSAIDHHDASCNDHFHKYLVLADSIGGRDFEVFETLKDKVWSDKEVSELIEDHLRQMAELIRRNEEKREKIKELHCKINGHVDEIGALRNCLQASPKKCTTYFLLMDETLCME
ncbi:hypothetical protein L484_013157 [Morus notabilis]|uniref:NAB domain-containing protein n=1 Tax=Morus notabilis TaxID=981085 RepID=W9RJX2_9ROSA|nr:hypothetical protein L484_013157 [Morus notabilis]